MLHDNVEALETRGMVTVAAVVEEVLTLLMMPVVVVTEQVSGNSSLRGITSMDVKFAFELSIDMSSATSTSIPLVTVEVL